MKPVRLGYYTLVEDFKSDGTIDISVADFRDGTIIEIRCDSFTAYNRVWESLAKGQQLGTPDKIRLEYTA